LGIESLESGDAGSFAMQHHGFPHVQVRLAGGGPQPAAFAKVRINVVLAAEFADLVNGRFGALRDAQRLVRAK